MNYQIFELSYGDRVMVARMRAGATRRDWAVKHGVSTYAVARAEKDNVRCDVLPEKRNPTDGEMLRIFRKRLDLDQQEVARRIGVSRLTMLKAERDRGARPTVDRLKKFYMDELS